MYIWFIVGIFFYAVSIQAQEPTNFMEHPSVEEQIVEQIGPLTLLELAPLSREEIIERLKADWNVHVKSSDSSLFDKYFLSFIYNYFQTMQPGSSSNISYELHSLGKSSHQLVSLRDENRLYFSDNAGNRTITARFKEFLSAFSNQTFAELPDEIQITFEYNNELYSQMNEAVLSSEDIKTFINRHSGITFHEKPNSLTGITHIIFQDQLKPFTHDELLMILKQYLELPLHIRDNLALKRLRRMSFIFSWDIFTITRGTYNHRNQTITLSDAAFAGTSGEWTFMHEIGHALWGESVWGGLSEETRKEYAKLSWQEDEIINDEFISNYSSTSASEDFAEHFNAYINNSEYFRHHMESKYNWLKEHIFLNTEYFPDVYDNLKIFVESEHGDTTPPYFIGLPYESITLSIGVEETSDLRSGSANIKLEVKGLFDDLSKIKSINILMQSEDDYFWIKSPEDFNFCSTANEALSMNCVLMDPKKPGWYAYHNNIKLTSIYDGDYKITQVRLEDKAGNVKLLRSNLGDVFLPFPGTKRILEEEIAKAERVREEAQQKRDAKEEEAQREREESKIRIETAVQKEIAAEEAKGLNILNLSEWPVRVDQNGEEFTTLQFGECISIAQEELSSLSLETVSGLFDLELDTVICSNIVGDRSKCHVKKNSLIKQNENGEYILADYHHEEEADFSQCRPTTAREEEKKKEEEINREKAAETAEGLNIVNLSEWPVRFYQNKQAVLDLEPKECVNITEQESLSLTLQKLDDRLDESDFICSNIANPLNLYKCHLTKTSVIKQHDDGEYILTDYLGEKSADFSQCLPLIPSENSVSKITQKTQDSPAPDLKIDLTPPYLTLPPSEAVSVSLENYDSALMKVEVKGLFDDLSKIHSITVFMKLSEDDYFWIRSPSRFCNISDITSFPPTPTCVVIDPEKPGQYMFWFTYPRYLNSPGVYRIQEVTFEDTLENERIIEDDFNNENNTLFFPGRKLLINNKTKKDINEDLEIRTSKTAEGDTVAHILTTDMTHFKLHGVYVKIEDTESGHELKYSIRTDQLSSLKAYFNSPSVPDKMNLPIVIPKKLESGKYRLISIAFKKSPYNRDNFVVQLDPSNPNAYFDHISNKEDNFSLRPVVDDIAMEVSKGENRKGGDTSILVNIPVEGLMKRGSVGGIIKTPTGETFSFSSDLKSNSVDHPQNTSVLISLSPNHPEGEYMITGISTTEYFSDVVNNHHIGLYLSGGGQLTHREEFLEKNIRTTLTISPPPPPEEKH